MQYVHAQKDEGCVIIDARDRVRAGLRSYVVGFDGGNIMHLSGSQKGPQMSLIPFPTLHLYMLLFQITHV